mgnify:CR=1 FL=1
MNQLFRKKNVKQILVEANTDKDLIILDATNAFGLLNIENVLMEIHQKIPQLFIPANNFLAEGNGYTVGAVGELNCITKI